MTDRRRLRANERVAHESLKGQIESDCFVKGEERQVGVATLPIFSHHVSNPDAARDRELIMGDRFVVLEEDERCAFGFAEKDGYVGYVGSHALAVPEPLTHMVIAPRSYRKFTPGLKSTSRSFHLPFGARLVVTDENDGWSEVVLHRSDKRPQGHLFYVPSVHLAPLPVKFPDPVGVADKFLGTPYLWGGNSSFGIDCSGLVQAACLACGIPCPGDSDMQEAELGEHLPEDAPLERGDLLFWKGHVAWVADPDTLIHANAFHMAVAYEPLQDAVKRIEAQGDGPVTARKRLGGPT